MSAILLLVAIMASANVEANTCNRKVDLLLALDASSTICGSAEPCEKWTALLQFCKNIVNSFNIGPDQARVALATYDNTTRVQWNLLKYGDKNSLMTAIDNVEYVGGEMNDTLSTSKIITEVFDPLVGDRDLPFGNVINFGILIGDGAPNFPDEVYADQSLRIRVTRQVVVLVVCVITGCTEHYARGVASYPKQVNETYFFVDNYLDVDRVREVLVNKVCNYQFPVEELKENLINELLP